jgi:CRP/FNR family transcriptional regulator, dissimilatory nitrate respiration regulator
MHIIENLSNTFLFSAFSSDQLEMLKTSVSLKNVNSGDQIFLENQTASAFFIIVSGKVKIYKLSPSGDEHILHVQTKGDIIAEAAIFDLKTYPANCQALEQTELLRISRERFIEILRHNPELSLKMMASYSKRLRQFVHMVEDLTFRDIKSRLAKYLISNCTTEKDSVYCAMDLSKKEIASLLGTIPETLSRTLDFLKKKNLISEKDKKIIILDLDKLKILADL